jgi:hypothetical protein
MNTDMHMTRPAGWCILSICALLLMAGSDSLAAEDHTGTLIQQASVLYSEAEFEEALKLLEQAVRIPGNSREQLIRIYHIRGLCQGSLGQYEATREAFARLLALSPGFQLSVDVAPRIRKHFDELSTQKPQHLALSLVPPIHAEPGKPLIISVEVVSDQMRMARALRVWHRRGDQGEYSSIHSPLHGPGKVQVSIPSVAWEGKVTSGPVSWYAVVEDANQGRLQSFGSSIHPLLVQVKVPSKPVSQPPPEIAKVQDPATPWYRRWWVWALIGGAVVSSGTIAWLLIDDQAPSGPVDFTVDVSTSR